MEKLLTKSAIRMARCDTSKQEEAPLSGEYVLPEYCPDMAVILKSFAYPRLQNRQWSGDQLMVDGIAVVRVIYADEQRSCVRTLEFAQPFSCVMRGIQQIDDAAIDITLSTKYLTCRALSPRRLEVRGSVLVEAILDSATVCEISAPNVVDGLYTRCESVPITVPCRPCEKIITVNESLEFDHVLPPAERLLGGECYAIVKECKLLAGKAIVKGLLYIHQLYTDSADGSRTHCLDYTIPFSQILDVPDAVENGLYRVTVQILSDSERCSIGPDGENTILDVTVKLLLQLQVYQKSELSLLYDAYHSRYPVEIKRDELTCRTFHGQRFDEMKCPVSVAAPVHQWQEILDISAQMGDYHCENRNGHCEMHGRIQIGVIMRDVDGEIGYFENFERIHIECDCVGSHPQLRPTVTSVRYHATEDALECIVSLQICMIDESLHHRRVISDLHLCSERPFATAKASAWLYYAEAGEMVWDIAQACHTSPQGILEENGLCSEEITEKTILLIPTA